MTEAQADVASLIHTADFVKLREELTHLRPQEISEVLAGLRADDQVIAFRILPRRLAAAVFEYLSPDEQRALVKAMGQEDVAALLNHMSPDDRTLFLERAAGERDAAAARAADAGRARRSGDAARLCARNGRPPDDAALHRRARGLDRRSRCSTTSASTARTAKRSTSSTSSTTAGVLIDDIRIREFLVVPLDEARVGADGSPVRRAQGDRHDRSRRSRCSGARTARRCRSPTRPAC